MSRDLLYKPPVPLVLPDEPSEGNKDRPATSRTNKLGLPTRARDLGGTQEATSKGTSPIAEPQPDKRAAPAPAAAEAPAPQTSPAFKAAYFNKDVEATAAVNQRASQMQALRGAQGVTDLRRIVLPQGAMASPDPATLRAASDRMGFLQGHPQLTALLSGQAALARGQSMTVERLQARLAALQAMVQARVAALARMVRLPADRVARGATLRQATAAQGAAMEHTDDVAADGNFLIEQASDEAAGMHRRVAKTLGIKWPAP